VEERKRSKPFKKCLSENEATFEFEKLIPKPYQRDHKPFKKSLDRKPLLNLKRHDGVINRRNGCGTSLLKKVLTENLSNDEINIVTIAGQRLRLNG
jgi:hypothetical protein